MVIEGTVYKLTNTLTHKTYIGSTQHLGRRLSQHRRSNNNCCSKKLNMKDISNVKCIEIYKQKFLNRNCMEKLEINLIRQEYRTNRINCVNHASKKNPILQSYIIYIKKRVDNTIYRTNNRDYWHTYFTDLHKTHNNIFFYCNTCKKNLRVLSLKAHNKTKIHRRNINKLKECGIHATEYKVNIDGSVINIVAKL